MLGSGQAVRGLLYFITLTETSSHLTESHFDNKPAKCVSVSSLRGETSSAVSLPRCENICVSLNPKGLNATC